MQIIIFINENGKKTKWDDYSDEEKREIGIKLNSQALMSMGYVPKK